MSIKKIDIHEAEANIDKLIDQAEHGKPFTISVDGKPVVKVSHIPAKELEKLPSAEDDDSPAK